MHPATIGDYRVERVLGSGAMGTVYLAWRGEARFAIKRLRSELVRTQGALDRFRREAELGRRVVHPNVVRTLEAGTLEIEGEPAPYLVMEYVAGRDLRAFLEEFGHVPEALLREIALKCAAGLEAIHAAGAVHRDLKPENVLISEAHEVRVMDLGVARLDDVGDALTQDEGFSGTVLYAAPEQLQDDPAGPAADLYALGVMLYELATGVNPFVRRTTLAVLQAQADYVPPPARERQPALSPFLSEVIARLMAKQAALRFPTAADLRRTLEEAEQSPWWREQGPRLAVRAQRLPRIPVPRATATHGRGAALEVLLEAWAAAQRGEGATVIVEGEAGIGKTRLLDDLVRSVDAEAATVLYGAFAVEGGLGALTEAIVARLGVEGLEDELARRLGEHAELVPAYAARLREEPPPAGASALPPEAFGALTCRLLQALAEEAPVLWLVDDVHLARDEGRGVLAQLVRAAGRQRALIVLSMQADGLSEEGRRALKALPQVTTLALDRLGARDVVDLLTDALQSRSLAEHLAGRIAAESDGVPLFVLEVLRALDAQGVLRRQPDGSYLQTRRVTSFSVPSTVRELIGSRLSDLPDEDRELLEVAAADGAEFDAGRVARVLGWKPVQALRRLAVLERRTGMVHTAGALYRFDQRQVRETLLEGLHPELKRQYHALLAEEFHASTPTGAAGDASAPGAAAGRAAYLHAFHHLQGSTPREALGSLEPALAHLERASLHEELLDLLEMALALDGLLTGPDRARLLLRQAGRLVNSLGRESALAPLTESLRLAGQAGEAGLEAQGRFLEARLTALRGDISGAQAGYERARELARAAGDDELEARSTGCLGVLLDNTGRHQEALPLLEHHLEDARRSGRRASEMIAACNLSLALRNVGRRDEALVHMRRHLELAQELGDRHGEAVACGNLSLLASDRGDAAEACAQLERNIELARLVGSRRSEAVARLNLAIEHTQVGRLDRALEMHRTARDLLHELGDVPAEAAAEQNLGATWTKVGGFGEALGHYERCLELMRLAGDRGGEAEAWVDHGRVLLALRRPAEARGSFESGGALAKGLGDEVGEAVALGDVAQSALDLGEVEEATRLAETAWRLLGARGNVGQRTRLALLRASLPGGSSGEAEEAFLARSDLVALPQRAVLYHALGEVTGERAHFATARTLLEGWLQRLPPAHRRGLEERVPRYGAILRGVPLAS